MRGVLYEAVANASGWWCKGEPELGPPRAEVSAAVLVPVEFYQQNETLHQCRHTVCQHYG